MANTFGRRTRRSVDGFSANPNAYNGLWDGVVIDVRDPDRRGRVKVRVFDLHDDAPADDIPWADPNFMAGFTSLTDSDLNGGIFHVPPVDSLVNVMFRQGDPEFPVWMGGWFPRDPAIRGREGYVSHVRRQALYNEDGVPSCPTWGTVRGFRIELDDEASEMRVTTPRGHKLTLSDSAANEHGDGIKLETRRGDYIWMDSDEQTLRIRFDGDLEMDVSGDMSQRVGGNLTVTVGGNYDRSAGGNEQATAAGNLYVDAPLISINGGSAAPGDAVSLPQGEASSGDGVGTALERLGNQLRKILTGDG
jgi:hypothetical protein